MSTTKAPTITLHRGWPTQNHFVWSPFVTKIEFRLRHSNTKYTATGGSPSQSPKGKIPYITITTPDDNNNTTDTFSDSTLITNHLTQQGHLQSLNTSLSPDQKLSDLAIRSLLEDKYYFYSLHERWIVNHYMQRDHILAQMPLPVRYVVGSLIYRKTNATLHGQGTGRFSDDEIDEFRCEIWRTIEEQLVVAKGKRAGEKEEPFWILGGTDATEADATVFGFVVSILVADSNPRSQEIVRSLPTVMEYAERILKKYFGEYRSWDA